MSDWQTSISFYQRAQYYAYGRYEKWWESYRFGL